MLKSPGLTAAVVVALLVASAASAPSAAAATAQRDARNAVASDGSDKLFDSVALGLTVPTPLGSVYDNLNRSVGVQAQTWLNWDFIAHTQPVFTAFYQPLSINGLSGRVNLVGVLAGLQTDGGPAAFGIIPTFALQIGAVGDWLTITGTDPGFISNDFAFGFATSVKPGLEIPIYGHASALVELPWTEVFYKNNFGLWSGVFSLRWKL